MPVLRYALLVVAAVLPPLPALSPRQSERRDASSKPAAAATSSPPLPQSSISFVMCMCMCLDCYVYLRVYVFSFVFRLVRLVFLLLVCVCDCVYCASRLLPTTVSASPVLPPRNVHSPSLILSSSPCPRSYCLLPQHVISFPVASQSHSHQLPSSLFASPPSLLLSRLLPLSVTLNQFLRILLFLSTFCIIRHFHLPIKIPFSRP